MAGKLDALPGERATISDWANHVSTIFPEVRLKRYLEMRGADSGPWRRLPALPAFWVGLLYDDDSLDAAWDLVKDWTAEERQKLRDDVPKLGFKAEIRDRSVLDPRQGDADDVRARACAPAPRQRLGPRRDAATCARSRNSSRAASRRRRSCWKNSTGRGAAASIRCSRNTLTKERRPCDDSAQPVWLGSARSRWSATPAAAQVGFDRWGGDYASFTLRSGDPAQCAARCERDPRCRAWAFSYPATESPNAQCWLKSRVTARIAGVLLRVGRARRRRDRAAWRPDRIRHRPHGRRLPPFRIAGRPHRQGLPARLRSGGGLPRLDLSAARLCRRRRPLAT